MDKYIKKSYDDLGYPVTIYLHFRGENAVRQIEVSNKGTLKLSEAHPVCGDAFLYDQDFSDIDWEEDDYISEKEFDDTWSR